VLDDEVGQAGGAGDVGNGDDPAEEADPLGLGERLVERRAVVGDDFRSGGGFLNPLIFY